MAALLTPRRRAALEAVEAGGVTHSRTGSYRNRGGDSVAQSAMAWLRKNGYVEQGVADWGAPSAPIQITDTGREALVRAREADQATP